MRSQANSTAYVDRGDGTKSKTLEFQEQRTLHGQQVDHKVQVVHTVSSDGDFPLSTEVSLERTWPDGRKLVAHHVKSLQADGGHRVAFHEEAGFPSGVGRVASWVKQVAVGGQVSGSGTVAMKKASGLFSRTWAVTHVGAAAANVSDMLAGVAAKVVISPQGDASATVTDDKPNSGGSANQAPGGLFVQAPDGTFVPSPDGTIAQAPDGEFHQAPDGATPAPVDTDVDDADATGADDVGTAMDEATSDDAG